MTKRDIGIGVIGGGWMGNVHSRAWSRLVSLDPEITLRPRLVRAADVDQAAVSLLQRRWGWQRVSTQWRDVVEDSDVEIVDICAPNDMHCAIALAAAEAGKGIYCEKPLGRSVEEARAMATAVREAGVPSFVGFNYRWMPAIQHARELAATGQFGEVTHFRSVFHTDWGANPEMPFSWRFDHVRAGSGVLGDAGSHVIDTAQAILGPIAEVTGSDAIFVRQRPVALAPQEVDARGTSVFGPRRLDGDAPPREVTNEDYFAALIAFASGARGTIEVSRVINGPRSRFTIDINGSEGSFAWDLERMNEYELWLSDDRPLEYGYRRVLVGPGHPDQALFSPGAGVGIAFEDSKAIETYHFLQALARDEPPDPDFSVGLRVAEVVDAIEQSFRTRTWVAVSGDDDGSRRNSVASRHSGLESDV